MDLMMDSVNFMEDIFKELPRLTPTWHDISYLENVRKTPFNRFIKDKIPDYSGAGVDVTLEDDELVCIETKHVSDNCGFAASKCSLPFLLPNKVADSTDLCLASLNKERENFLNFCSTLHLHRIKINTKRFCTYQKEILSTQKILKKMSLKNTFKKIEVPLSILQLATNLPKKVIFPPVNMLYAGGSLAVSGSVDDNKVILHPVGEKLNKLGFTALKEDNDLDKHYSPQCMKNYSVKLKSGCILQIANSIDGYCYVRQKESCHFVDFTDLNNVSSSRVISKEELMTIASSPYSPLDYVVINSMENLQCNNLEVGKTLWSLKKDDYCFPYGEIETMQCGFGSHPQSIMVLNEQFCNIFDMRLKEKKKSVLFSTDFASCFLTEKLINIKGCAVNSFQHLISSDMHLFICDERYPKTPVLIYNHMLSGYPLYSDVTTCNLAQDSSNAIVVLGTQDTNELSAFSIKAQHTLVQPVALSPLLHLSSPVDCLESLKMHCIHVEDFLVQRFSCPLVGISVTSHNSSPNSGFSVFQLNSLGDLFYQDFYKAETKVAEKSYKVNTGCILTPPEKILPSLSEFKSVLCEQNSVESSTDQFLNLRSDESSSTDMKVNLYDIFSAMENSSICGLCFQDKECLNNDVDQISLCPSCGCSSMQSQSLKHSFKELNLLSGSLNEQSMLSNFDISSFYDFDDVLGKKILDVWEIVDNDSENEATMCNYDSDFSFATSTPAISCSPSTSSMTDDDDRRSTGVSTNSKDDLMKQLFTDISSVNPPKTNFSNQNQEMMDDIIPPSQDILPLIGETIRKIRKSNTKLNLSSGF